MSKSLGELFAEAATDTVNHRGRIVKALVRIPVRDGATVTVLRRSVGAPRPQALKLALNDGELEVNEQRSAAVSLWTTTSPDEVTLSVHGEKAKTLDVWNGWSVGGVDSSWVGSAGIVTKSTASSTILRCSDGVGAPEFSDLEVEIFVEL